MLRQTWRLIVRAALVLGVLLGFLAFVELFRIFAMFYRFRPAFGWTFLGLLLALLVWAWWALRREWSAIPRVLAPPPLPPLPEASFKQLRAFCLYLVRYIKRLEQNPAFDEDQQRRARQGIEYIEETLGAHPLREDLMHTIDKIEHEVVHPLLEVLEEQASRHVRDCVRDVMLGVTLSPYRSMDLFIVLYRNGGMVLRIARIYQGRPGGREQWLVLRDTLHVVAAVNLIHMGRNLLEGLFAQVPLLGRVLDDIGQGLGAGFFTSVAGHAAMQRCAASRSWSREQGIDSIRTRSQQFLTDVRDVFLKDIFPHLRGRIRSTVPEDQMEQPGFWEQVTGGITGAVDATAHAVGDFIITPVFSGAQGVLRAGVSLTQGVSRRGKPKTRRKRRRKPRPDASSPVRPRGVRRIFKLLTQRIRYSRGPR